LVGVSTEGEFLGVGIRTEYGYNFMEKSKDFYEFIVNLDYTFDFQTYMMVEYYRNTLGKTNSAQYSLNDWMRLLSAEQKAISQDQVYMLVQHPLTDLIGLGISGIISLSDGSIALVPTLNYNLFENLDLMMYVNVNFGKSETAYSQEYGSGGLIRARIYF
jgi:hypothetical protein